MLLNQGCLLIYTSVGNTWISLLSMLHNRFPERFCLFFIMYLVFMCTVPKEERLGGGPALPPGEPSLAELPGTRLTPVASWHSTLGQ